MSAAQILVVDDESDIRELVQEILTDEGYAVTAAADAASARDAFRDDDPDLVLLDIWMPDTDGITLLKEWAEAGPLASSVVMMSGHGTVDTAVEATRLGAFDFIEKPLSLAKLLHTVERALESQRRMRKEPSRVLGRGSGVPVGKSVLMHRLREEVRSIAPHDTNVLLTGEPGTGREAFARYMHSLSPRANGPYQALIAGSITAENAETQLYGEVRDGAISPGYLRRAMHGTLFINELEDLCADGQRFLLSAIEMGSFTPRGGSKPVPLDVRFLSSASPSVTGSDSRVRRDLLGSLSVVPLRVPPLRQYSEDVPELLRNAVDKLVDRENLPLRRFSIAAQNRLRNYPWPGNVGELRNLVHRLLIIGGPDEVSLEEVENALGNGSGEDEPLVKQDLLALPLREAREQFERAYLQQQLKLCGGKVGILAKRVGMERTHLYRKLRSLGVDFGQSGSDD